MTGKGRPGKKAEKNGTKEEETKSKDDDIWFDDVDALLLQKPEQQEKKTNVLVKVSQQINWRTGSYFWLKSCWTLCFFHSTSLLILLG